MNAQTLDRTTAFPGRRTTRPWRAVLGAAVMAVALGAGQATGEALTRWTGLTGFAGRLALALLVTAIAVPLILVLRRRDRAPAARFGLTGSRTSAGGFLLGVAVVAGAAAVTFGAGTAAGWLRWTALEPAALLAFVATNAVIAILLEALPEELSLRGYAWGTLRERYGPVRTGLLTTGLFLTVLPAASVLNAALTRALGADPAPIGLAPAGEDPVAYVILMLVFGCMLVTARAATTSATVWTCVGAHLTFLTVNRVVLFGEERSAGWSADLVTPDAILLVPVYLLLAAAAFAVLGRRSRRVQPAELAAVEDQR
jgi:hypothetical protein